MFNVASVVKNSVYSIVVLTNRRLMELSAVVRILDNVAPLHLAEKWDNVGLLVEANRSKKISSVLMTNDLTANVLSEAVEKKANLIISYHPPIFIPLKSLTTKSWKQNIVLQCIQSDISIYSPHTALDAVSGGVNDWLISCFELKERKPITQSFNPHCIYTHCINLQLPVGSKLDQILDEISGVRLSMSIANEVKMVKILSNSSSLVDVMEVLSTDSGVLETAEMYKLEMNPLTGNGMGRVGSLKKAITLNEALNILKHHIGLAHLRIALGIHHTLDTAIAKIAVCAGSGSSILQEAKADLFITGEMSHHELLNATHKNTTVFLCEHSNSERGFLQIYAKMLQEKLLNVMVIISEKDRDPITIV